jgi:hypothetical protein
MLISKKRKFIFIHIYKNAGTSVTYALRPKWMNIMHRLIERIHPTTKFGQRRFPIHIEARELVKAIGRETFDSYFSFAIVRNPWDWQVSLYNYLLIDTYHPQHSLVKSFGSFDKYIRWRCAEEVRFQKDFIYSEDGELLVDFVAKYERLDDDFKTICSRIGVSASLPKLNVSNTKPYRQFYNEETKELVRRTYEPDIKLFGYEF